MVRVRDMHVLVLMYEKLCIGHFFLSLGFRVVPSVCVCREGREWGLGGVEC